jgi:hypothetical protein
MVVVEEPVSKDPVYTPGGKPVTDVAKPAEPIFPVIAVTPELEIRVLPNAAYEEAVPKLMELAYNC